MPHTGSEVNEFRETGKTGFSHNWFPNNMFQHLREGLFFLNWSFWIFHLKSQGMQFVFQGVSLEFLQKFQT